MVVDWDNWKARRATRRQLNAISCRFTTDAKGATQSIAKLGSIYSSGRFRSFMERSTASIGTPAGQKGRRLRRPPAIKSIITLLERTGRLRIGKRAVTRTQSRESRTNSMLKYTIDCVCAMVTLAFFSSDRCTTKTSCPRGRISPAGENFRTLPHPDAVSWNN